MTRLLQVLFAVAILALLVVGGWTVGAAPQRASDQQLRNAAADDANWLMYGRTYDEQRFSPLQQINEDTVGRLGLVWSRELPTTRGVEATPVVVDGVMFGLSHLNRGQYFGLDLDTGEVLWTSDPRQAANAAILNVGTTILSLEADAELVVVSHSRTGFEPVQRYEVADSATWTLPTLSGNRMFVKDVESLTLWTVE